MSVSYALSADVDFGEEGREKKWSGWKWSGVEWREGGEGGKWRQRSPEREVREARRGEGRGGETGCGCQPHSSLRSMYVHTGAAHTATVGNRFGVLVFWPPSP